MADFSVSIKVTGIVEPFGKDDLESIGRADGNVGKEVDDVFGSLDGEAGKDEDETEDELWLLGSSKTLCNSTQEFRKERAKVVAQLGTS